MNRRLSKHKFLFWFIEVSVCLALAAGSFAMSFFFDNYYLLALGMIFMILIFWRMRSSQLTFEYQESVVQMMKDYCPNILILTWIGEMDKAVISGDVSLLRDDDLTEQHSLSKKELSTLLSRLRGRLENDQEQIYEALPSETARQKAEGKGDIPKNYYRIRIINMAGKMTHYLIEDVTAAVSSEKALATVTYYDASQHILGREGFMARLREKMSSNSAAFMSYLSINVYGMEKATADQQASVDKFMENIGRLLLEYEKKDSLVGRMSPFEYALVFCGMPSTDVMKHLSPLEGRLRECLSQFNDTASMKASFAGGICHYPAQAEDEKNLRARAEFAAFERHSSKQESIAEFSEDTYEVQEREFIRIKELNRLIKNNLFDYHFQPIVNAHTGDIFAYEALMRPRSDIIHTPPELIHIAEQENRLKDIELATIENTFRILHDNLEVIEDRKLFVNSIPNSYISDADYQRLKGLYGAGFKNLVVEITEEWDLEEDTLRLINERYRSENVLIALDDYGSGYSNASNLLRSRPDLVKLDRALLVNIDKDSQKYRIVADLVGFAKEHGIMVIAEGIESYEEFSTVLDLDVDLIQGFYTGKPRSYFQQKIDSKVQEEIMEASVRKRSRNVEQA